ncbi:MAG: hypothetical protein QNJ04_13750 [Desulfobacterales bacterium]|nr:hypothetical protein [Desulfobacterales bacterium]
MKRFTAALIFIILVCLTSPPAYAQDLQAIFSGIPWGSPAEEVRGLELVRQQGEESYYAKPDDFYSLGGVTCEKVVYGFYQNRFFGAFMTVKDEKEFRAVRAHLTERYGDARSQMRLDRTIYIWDYLEVKIKLKHYEGRPKAKLAFYYTPLSTEVNEARKSTQSETVIKLDSGQDDEITLDF